MRNFTTHPEMPDPQARIAYAVKAEELGLGSVWARVQHVSEAAPPAGHSDRRLRRTRAETGGAQWRLAYLFLYARKLRQFMGQGSRVCRRSGEAPGSTAQCQPAADLYRTVAGSGRSDDDGVARPGIGLCRLG